MAIIKGWVPGKISFKTADEVFRYLYDHISSSGIDYGNTKCVFNIGFEIEDPMTNLITTKWRKWNLNYADREWKWYLSGNRSAKEIAKHAQIWYKCMDEYGDVNSNYGAHWQQNGQLDYVISLLKEDPTTRRASLSIYNAKNRYNYKNDTPCTYAINFYIHNGALNMSVVMRSNDLWYGFCNDQYCFSRLQQLVSIRLGLSVGTYYHFVNNMHIYKEFLNRKTDEV
tara:strand:- start:477 stop:1154 length:678 start_codon:yes stop_codon:yes gene_type:complete